MKKYLIFTFFCVALGLTIIFFNPACNFNKLGAILNKDDCNTCQCTLVGLVCTNSICEDKKEMSTCNLESIRGNEKFSPSILFDAQYNKITEMTLTLYFDHQPNVNEIQQIESLGVFINKSTWVPPLKNNPLGFYMAVSKIENICELDSLDFIKKIDYSNFTQEPL